MHITLRLLSFIGVLLLLQLRLSGQNELYQLSGIVSEAETNLPISYANINVLGKYEWNHTNQDGFFSCVVGKEDTILFTAMGYKSKMYVVPDSVSDNIFSIAVFLNPDTLFLGEIEIYPWPSREEFREAFLNYKEVTEYEIGALPGIKRPDQIDTIPKAPTYMNPISLLYEQVVVPIQWKKKKKDKARELPKWE